MALRVFLAVSYPNAYGRNAPGSCRVERAFAQVDAAVSSPLRTFERNAVLLPRGALRDLSRVGPRVRRLCS